MIFPVALLFLAQLSPQPTSRTVHQDGSGWRCDYTFRHSGPDPLTIHPSDVSARIHAESLTNPRPGVPGQPAQHAHGWPVRHTIDGSSRSSVATLVDNGYEPNKCHEKATVLIWSDTPGAVAAAFHRRMPEVGPPTPPVALAMPPGEEAAPQVVTVGDGGLLNVRIVFRHEHEGNHGLDPLLGVRDITIKLGDWTFRDTIDMRIERYVHMPELSWSPMDAVPEAHRDDGIYFSPPYSLILDADEPGMQYFRYPERRVRGGIRMRLRFRYLIPVGLDGEVKVRVAQYRESPNAWKVLSEGGFERVLPAPVDGKPSKNGTPGEKAVARWRLWDEVLITQPECTTVAVDVRISDADSGLAWIDDMSLDYVGGGTNGPTAP